MTERASGPPASRNTPYGGLCPACTNVKIVRSSHGSQFLLCRLSASDDAYPKYPPQPVLACPGYVRIVPASDVR